MVYRLASDFIRMVILLCIRVRVLSDVNKLFSSKTCSRFYTESKRSNNNNANVAKFERIHAQQLIQKIVYSVAHTLTVHTNLLNGKEKERQKKKYNEK